MPLNDCHDTYSGIAKILGKIDDVRVEGAAVVGRASLARKHAELLPDIIDGYTTSFCGVNEPVVAAALSAQSRASTRSKTRGVISSLWRQAAVTRSERSVRTQHV